MERIRSINIIKQIFGHLKEKKTARILKYNKKLTKQINWTRNDIYIELITEEFFGLDSNKINKLENILKYFILYILFKYYIKLNKNN